MERIIRVAGCVVVLACAALVCGCNTTKGVGADIEKAGDSLKDSADKHGAD